MSFSYLNNPILDSDSYKFSHYEQLPDETTNVFSYIASRGGEWPWSLVYGLNIWIKESLLKPITQSDIDEAEAIILAHGEPFNRAGWQHILNAHGGYLPLSIRAVPEGLIVPTQNVLVTFETTDPAVPWLSSFVETPALRAVWYGTTVATQSKMIKNLILQYLEETGTPEDINFKLHDFGARGVSSKQSAGIGGSAHLINFMGTDTVTGLLYAMRYYDAGICGFSIPAAEHSTVTAFGREGETAAYKRMIDKFGKPGAMFAVVSDGYDIDNAVENIWGGTLREQVVASGATLVVRPDSGHPATIVLRCVEKLASKFGFTVNSKGFKVINKVRVIQGDGINYDSIKEILDTLKAAGFSADNVAFGMGGALLQGVNRDTQKFAQKCSAIEVGGERWLDVYKDPVTDPGKRSLKGKVKLVKLETGEYRTIRHDEVLSQPYQEVMQEVYRNGKLLVDPKFSEIRARSNQ